MQRITMRSIAPAALATVLLMAIGAPALGQAAPNFEPATIDGAIEIGYGLAIGDVDGDGKPDILLADKRRIVWYRNGDWSKHVMAEGLTERDNVCIAARDIDGDGKVEVAVGAQWNPGNTTDASQSGAIFYLIRPADPASAWEPVKLPHDPTTHRMHWFKRPEGVHQLIVLPLHGIGNQRGEGAGVKVTAYTMPADPRDEWKMEVIDDELHMTHNFDVAPGPGGMEWLLIAGREGVKTAWVGRDGMWQEDFRGVEGQRYPAGEVRAGAIDPRTYAGLYATVEPMHGNTVAAYGVTRTQADWVVERTVVDESLAEGHGLVVADLLKRGSDQIVAGWRNPDADGKVGIRMYVKEGDAWTRHTIDDNTMAVEDLKAADLDGDGDLDLIASGRATKNLMVYWNRTGE